MTNNDHSRVLGTWGTSLLNKLPGITRNRRKRDASKRRRERDRVVIEEQSHSDPDR